MEQVQKLLHKIEYATKVASWLVSTIRGALSSFPKYEEPNGINEQNKNAAKQ